jgi:hypothetical protein
MMAITTSSSTRVKPRLGIRATDRHCDGDGAFMEIMGAMRSSLRWGVRPDEKPVQRV